jgi:hypothetical protein
MDEGLDRFAVELFAHVFADDHERLLAHLALAIGAFVTVFDARQMGRQNLALRGGRTGFERGRRAVFSFERLFQRLDVFGERFFKQLTLLRGQLLRLRAKAPAFEARQLQQQSVDLDLAIVKFLFVAGDRGANGIPFEQRGFSRLPQGGDIVADIQIGQIHAKHDIGQA